MPHVPLVAPVIATLVLTHTAAAARPVDFERDVLPIFERACVECHGPQKASGGLQLTTADKTIEGGFAGESVVPGKPDESYLMERLLGHGDEDRMPIKGAPLTDEETAVIRRWIAEGAHHLPVAPPAFMPKTAGVSRLTNEQYRTTLHTLFGDTLEVPGDLEPDMVISGSAVVGAARFALSRRATEQYATAAFAIARQAVKQPAWRQRWLSCLESPRRRWDDGARRCADDLVTRFGRLVWRRPLSDRERARYLFLADETGRRHGDAERAVVAVLAGLLQSPNFLYRIELGIPDAKAPSTRKLDDYELATRLSYFLVGTTPDEALLDAAARGELSREDGLRAQALRLLESPRARATVRAFFAELFELSRLDRVVGSRKAWKDAAEGTAAALRAETLKLIESVVFDDGRDFREIFDARHSFVNVTLARHYGLPFDEMAPADADGFVKVELAADRPRLGVLGHASFLAVNASHTESSPTRRGKFIREKLLCQAVPPPPPDVESKLPEHNDAAPATLRARLDAHRSAKQCKGCHKAMDPMGFAFEHFDAVGWFREKDNGQPIDASGDLDGVPFNNAAELGRLLRQSERVGVCMARNLFRFALGTLETEADEPLIEELRQSLEKSGHRFRALLIAVVASRGFRYVSSPL